MFEWTDEDLAVLGTASDVDLAAGWGVSKYVVRRKRQSLGITAYRYNLTGCNGGRPRIDPDDMHLLNERRWNQMKKGYWCATRPINGHWLLHRAIMDPPANMQVDHINGDPNDNRRCNLRLVTNKQNANGYQPQRPSRFGYTGVCRGSRGRFKASICVNGKNTHLGSFDTPEEAHAAYLGAKKLLTTAVFGEEG